MSHVIKATDRNRGVHGVAFNFDDMARQASGYLDKIREEAGADTCQGHARCPGHPPQSRDRRSQGGRASRRKVDRSKDRRANADAAAGPAIRHRRNREQQTGLVGPLGEAGGEAGRGHRVARDSTRAGEIARHSAGIGPGSIATCRRRRPGANSTQSGRPPGVGRRNCRRSSRSSRALRRPKSWPTPSITPGGCRVETRYGAIDQQFEAQLARIEEELT